jgi:hypothetical protein
LTILFLHGWHSVTSGVKPTCLKDHGHEVINPKLSDNNLRGAVRVAPPEFDRHQPNVVVGSSRGGAVAMNINSGDARLESPLAGLEELGEGELGNRESSFVSESRIVFNPYA